MMLCNHITYLFVLFSLLSSIPFPINKIDKYAALYHRLFVCSSVRQIASTRRRIDADGQSPYVGTIHSFFVLGR